MPLGKERPVNIALISLTEDVFIPSLRYLSAHLRAQGHQTTLILLPWCYTDRALHGGNSFLYPYPPEILEQVAERCREADLVGLSLMTCHFDNAVHVTRFLRQKLQAPIIWGGMHPTLRPGECLQHADMVCVGEGEISTAQLAAEMTAGKSWQSVAVRGILQRCDGQCGSASPSPIVEDLNELPLPDYDLDHQYLLHEGSLVRLDGRLLARCLGSSYVAMFSRGCPYSCTYCGNNALRTLYQRKLSVRWRSVDNRIRELEAALRLMPEIQEITFADDAFLAQPMESLRDFTARYRERIQRPFSLLTTPRSVTEEKLTWLAEAGLYSVAIGVQSGSQRIYKGLYSRPETLEEIVSASHRLKYVARKLGKQILGRYDFILDNPWESPEDVEASIRLCTKLSKPFNLALFSLTLYPGTELYDKARREGRITDDLNQVYRSSQLMVKPTYLNGVFAALSANVPRWLVACLLWPPLRRSGPVWLPYRVAKVFELLKLARGFLGYVMRGEWRIIRFLWRQGWARVLGAAKPDQKKPRFSGAPGQFSVQPG
jgi:anaerobic magnesium-protoporphyrin IX monomethyl ester cyclase